MESSVSPVRKTTEAQRRAIANWKEKNRDRFLAYQKRWHEENRERVAHDNRFRRFGITAEEYNEMLRSQDGLCAICGREETYTCRGRVRALAVDHNHETGRIRGLLCCACNKGIGCFADDPERIQLALTYLQEEAADGTFTLAG